VAGDARAPVVVVAWPPPCGLTSAAASGLGEGKEEGAWAVRSYVGSQIVRLSEGVQIVGRRA
jgi:hypothetical protein